MDGERYEIGAWRRGRSTLTATGTDPATAIAAALTGLLAASRPGPGHPDESEATTAVAIRAEGANVAELFAGLASALFDDLDHDEYDVRAVRFDGMVRTDRGLAGWGYALAVPGKGPTPVLSVEDVAVTQEAGGTVLRATVTRAG